MRAVFEALNRLVTQGLIETYAIGGAVGASFYIAALNTEDIDAFVFLPPSDSVLALLSPIYDSLQTMGGVVEGAHVRFGSWPLQLLTDANELIAEAIKDASTSDFEGTAVRVFRPEHLCAVALQTGRKKDLLRVALFLEQGSVDVAKLTGVASRFGLEGQLERVKQI